MLVWWVEKRYFPRGVATFKKITDFFKDDRFGEQKLFEKRDRKQRNFRVHRRAYTVVIVGFMILNLLLLLLICGALAWVFFFWFFFAIVWGMGFAMHGFSYRAWMTDNERDIAMAEWRFGRLFVGKSLKQLLLLKDVLVIEGIAIFDDEWCSILIKAKVAIARVFEVLDEVQHQQVGVDELKRQLSDGMLNIERFAVGVERIIEALEEIALDGGDHLESEFDAIDSKINDTKDDQLCEVYHANRSMLVVRKAKLEVFDGERARMKVNAEGFLIAAENVCLDIAGMGSGEKSCTSALVESVRRLSEEVEILRKVEAELKQFT